MSLMVYDVDVSDVTVLLSLTVFLNTVSETMPNTSDAVPLISKHHSNYTTIISALLALHCRGTRLLSTGQYWSPELTILWGVFTFIDTPRVALFSQSIA